MVLPVGKIEGEEDSTDANYINVCFHITHSLNKVTIQIAYQIHNNKYFASVSHSDVHVPCKLITCPCAWKIEIEIGLVF